MGEHEGLGFVGKTALWLFLAGLFASSFLALRVGAFSIGDVLLIASALFLLAEPRSTDAAPGSPRTQVVFFLLLIGGLLAAFRSTDPGSDLATIVRLLYLVCVLPWQARVLLRNAEGLRRGMIWFVAGGALSVGGSLLQYAFGASVIPNSMVTNAGRYSGFTSHVSDTGGIACVVIVAAVAGLASKSGRGARLSMLAAVVLSAIGLILSGSVAGMLSATVGVVYLVLKGNIGWGRAVVLAVSASVIGLAAIRLQQATGVALSPTERLLQALGLTGSADGLNTTASRLDTIRTGLAGIADSPIFGAGIDPESARVVGDLAVHNLYISSFYQGGVLVFVAMVVVTWSAFRRLWARGMPQVVVQAQAGFLTALVFAMTAPSFYNRYFWIPVALAAVASMVELSSASDAGLGRRPLDLGILASQPSSSRAVRR
ncbi:O-antigen ligase family protein [Clavibacter michiganensis]|uniref:O-antigen ligase-related domain-containing protein n=1 Tax=Clavibacter michiganensis TaxID=28447 RepID=A0A251YTJ7_9MICO|nr:O-antigen ligase family protein [Clavibacter michiganensis]OUE27587.1 hypothetical protein BFL37_01525 [Clavibacter michiganensis]